MGGAECAAFVITLVAITQVRLFIWFRWGRWFFLFRWSFDVGGGGPGGDGAGVVGGEVWDHVGDGGF